MVGGAGYGANGFDTKLQLTLHNNTGKNLGSFLVDTSTRACTDNLGDRLPPSIRNKIRYEMTIDGSYFPEVRDTYTDDRNLCIAQMTQKPDGMERRPTL